MTTPRDVAGTYDRIAEHFSSTREYAWPEVEDFLEDRHAHRALDLGCGNGRHAELLAEYTEHVIGVDASTGLLHEARARSEQGAFDVSLVAGDAARIPLASNIVDLGVYVATIHHLPSRKQRVESLRELARVLTAGGVALISAWSTAHDKFDQDEGFDTTIDWTLPGGETVPRFYHIYSPDELREDLESAGVHIDSFEVSSGNCYVIIRREGKRP